MIQLNNEKNRKPRRGFTALFAMLDQLEQQDKLANMPQELVAAVAIVESHANMFFCKCDLQYRQNMRVAVNANEMNEAAILSLITIRTGLNAAEIPKFRYEPSWRFDAQKMANRMKPSAGWTFKLACSYGLCQKSMWIHLSPKPIQTWEAEFWKFVSDPHEQLKVCANDLSILLKNSDGDLGLALTRYNAGPNARRISAYGEKVKGVYAGLLTSNP